MNYKEASTYRLTKLRQNYWTTQQVNVKSSKMFAEGIHKLETRRVTGKITKCEVYTPV
jgi:hypothetical protein